MFCVVCGLDRETNRDNICAWHIGDSQGSYDSNRLACNAIHRGEWDAWLGPNMAKSGLYLWNEPAPTSVVG